MGFKKVKITDEVAAAVKAELEQAVAAAEPVKKEKKQKKDKTEKKVKTEKKIKKEKVDKEEKTAEPEADAETNTDAHADIEMPDADADADNEPTNASASKKRKSEIEEIEVDLSLPEPPSKKAKRMLKKGKDPNAISKAKKKAAASDEDLLDVTPGETETNAGDKKDGTSKKPRSEHCVWVGNMPFHVTTADLRKWLVENSGGVILETSITRVKMPSSKEHKLPNGDRQNKGFAYVDFDTLGGKVAAIALSENMLGSRKLLIKDSTSFEGRPKVEAAAGADGGKAEDAKVDPKTLTKSERDATKKVYVGNLPFAATEDDVYTLFEKCGEIDWVKVATFEDSGKCKGYGWVKFKEPEAAAAAVKGWIMLPQFEDNVEDFQTEEDKAAAAAVEEGNTEEGAAEADGEDKPSAKPKKAKKQKMRKWHVNRLKGRELKVELAEDNKVRYEKRFGRLAKNKGAKGAAAGEGAGAGEPAAAEAEA